MNKTIIFDFDGTLANTLDAIVKIVNQHTEEFGYRKITKKDIPYLQGKKPKEILSHMGISIIKLPFWIKKIHSEMNNEISNISPTVKILPVLLKLKKKYQLGILTSNTQENVKLFLEKNNMNFFDFIYTGKSVFGKKNIIKKAMKQQKINRNKIIYVCDEIRDIEAAKKLEIKIIAVTWGYNNKNALEKENPDFIIDVPEDLENIVMKEFEF